MAQEGSRRSEGVRRRRPFVVAYNALHVRPGVYDGAATFSLNVVQRLPEVLPDARIVAYVAEGEDRLEPRPNLELRPRGRGTGARAGPRRARDALADGRPAPHRGIGADLAAPVIPCATSPVVVVAQNLVYHRHGLGDAFVGRERRDRFRSNFSARYYRRRMAEAYAKAAAVVAVSGHTADMLVGTSQLDRSKTVVVHEGSDSMFLGSPEVPATRRQRLLAVSTLAPYKNLEAAIEVLARLRRQRPELVLDIAGSDWRGFKTELEEHAVRHGVAEAVNFLGLVEARRAGAPVRAVVVAPAPLRVRVVRSASRRGDALRAAWSQPTASRRCRRSPPVPQHWRTRTTSTRWRQPSRACSTAVPPSSSSADARVPAG